MKLEYTFAFILFYTLLFHLISNILEDGEHYLKLYESIRDTVSERLFHYPVTESDAYIINAYYYPQSKSFGDNAIAIVFLMNRNTMRDITKYRMQLVGSNNVTSVRVTPRIIKEVYSPCSLVNSVAVTNVLPDMNKLEMVTDVERMQVRVIICLSPQFVAEQWLLFVAHAHVARRFGGHLHLYVTSMVDSYFELVQEYERHGYVTIDFWMRMKFANASESSVEPNANSEWRNQAGAHTDCLLQYKEAATFVAFFDLDDVLFPRGFESYFDEFAAYSFFYPTIKTFHYNKKEYAITKEARMTDMNFEKIFGHSLYQEQFDTGKVVARPEDIDSMWIHRSFNVPERQSLWLTQNYLLHLQKPKDANGDSPVPYVNSTFVETESMRQNATVLASIQKDFLRMINSTEIQRISDRLPVFYFYFPIVFKCYFDMYYSRPDSHLTCPTIEGCELPEKTDLKCVHSDANYVSGPKMSPVTFHYHTNSRWSRTIGCRL